MVSSLDVSAIERNIKMHGQKANSREITTGIPLHSLIREDLDFEQRRKITALIDEKIFMPDEHG
jgi:hypothetical protein